ncbi:MAG: isopentenyl-diphosphate delta-isomerase [Crocinitomicaceae bacterium]|jgi:isopentenyl-diphosphate delta-isomerase
MEKVILVDAQDQPIGEVEKLEAHEKGMLHRAFSVFIFNEKNELLLQKRASSKYHSGGLWSNSCCSHPRIGENIRDAGQRRLQEELGFTTDLSFIFSFIYQAELDHGLTEHEFDHVLIGHYSEPPNLNPEEVEDWRYISMEEIEENIKQTPDDYTIWFKVIFDRVKTVLAEHTK